MAYVFFFFFFGCSVALLVLFSSFVGCSVAVYFSTSPGVYIYIIGLFVLWEISRHLVILLCLVVFFLYGYFFLDIYEFAIVYLIKI